MRKICRSLALSIALLAACHCVVAQEAGPLEVKGSLVKARSFQFGEIDALPHAEISETRSVGAGQQQDTQRITYRGVLLRTLLEASGFKDSDSRELRTTVIVARARDRYIALFTWGELFNSRAGDNVLVITAIDGKKLPETDGPYALRSFGDTRPGPRHVKWLQQIEVMKVAP